MTKPRTSKRFLALLAITGLLTASLGACGTEKPTPLVIPEVVWTHGPPEGLWEDTEWVQALRREKLLLAAAELSHNYSDPILLEVATYDQLVSIAEDQKKTLEYEQAGPNRPNGRSFIDWPAGPMPFEVKGLQVAPDRNSAAVEICYSSYWTVTTSREAPSLNMSPTSVLVPMVRKPGGIVWQQGPSSLSGRRCDTQKQITGGLFDPPVVAPRNKEVKPGDVKFPLKSYAPTTTDS